MAATQGRTTSDWRLGEPQSIRDALIQAIGGATVYRGETLGAMEDRGTRDSSLSDGNPRSTHLMAPNVAHQKEQRLQGTIAKREAASNRYLDSLEKAYTAGKLDRDRFTREFKEITDVEGLDRRVQGAQRFLSKMANSPRFIDTQGNISNDGKAVIRRVFLFVKAAKERLEALEGAQR